MALSDILVCLDPTDAGEVRLKLAAAVARAHRAHLSAAYVLEEESAGAAPYGGLGGPSQGAAGITASGLVAGVAGVPVTGVPPEAPSRAAALADIVEQRFREAVQPHAIEGDWHLFNPGEGEELLALARASDLVVIGQTSPDYLVPAGFRPEDLVAVCGRPLLIVPYAGNFAAVGGRVLIAWDGTREATRAVHDSLPLFAAAEAVTVMTVGASEAALEHGRPSLARLVRHLARHGIAATPEETLGGGIPVADLLLSRAADFDVDLIVAGAYHHWPLREALLGGVSRDLLDHMTVPVLMSH